GRTEPLVLTVDDVLAGAVGEARRLLDDGHGTVAVIAPKGAIDDLTKLLLDSGLPFGELGQPVTLHAAPAVKGLEFDAVGVVEPAAIVDDAPRGLRLLYVALTRPTRHLSVVHREPMPGGLS